MHENIKKKMGRWKSFDEMDGLGHNTFCLLEDKKGNIWVGTGSGLSRYDGKEFITFHVEDGLADNQISCLCQDSEGNLWIGSWKGGLSKYDGAKFVNFSQKEGLASNWISCIYQDREGNIWIGTVKSGLSKYDGAKFVNFAQKDGLVSQHVNCIYQDREGNIWIGGDDGSGLNKYDGKEFVNFTHQKDGLTGNNISRICEDRAGNLWIGTGSGLSKYDGKRFVNISRKCDLFRTSGSYVSRVFMDREGNLWLSVWGDGVICYSYSCSCSCSCSVNDGNEFVHFTAEDGLANDFVFEIIQDREGGLWFACGRGGLSRYNPYEISTISNESVNGTMIKDRSGHLWWGCRDVLSRYDGKEINHYHGFGYEIYELFEDGKGQLWVGSLNDLYRYDDIKDLKGKNPRRFTTDDGLSHNWIWKIHEDGDGNIWLGTYKGLNRYNGENGENGEKFINFTIDDWPGSNCVSAICQDKKGRLWFGAWAAGIASYDGKTLRIFTGNEGLGSDSVSCMAIDDKGNLWIGTTAGVSCYDGKAFKNYTLKDGLLGGYVWRILQDSQGQIWIATLGGGISRFDGKNFQALTTDDGLPSNCVTGIIEDFDKAQSKDSDGSIIISTYKGTIRYTPDYKTSPLIQIDEVDADKKYKEPAEIQGIQGIQISKGVASIRIKYHGISFKTKRMRYNYILEGYDKDWQATWDEEVRYENLPSGEYVFKVMAINRDLVYSEAPAEVKLIIQPDPRDVELAVLRREIDSLRGEVGRKYHFENIIGRSASIKQVYSLMEKAIDSGLTVLISGETGVGKELIAKAIHYNSPRQNHPLLDLDCGSVPKDLVASILFGHRKGAFTGAYEDAIGILEAAAGGTVILDEISAMPNEAQVHFLRALQERKIRRVGETQLRDIDVRIIAITNKDLKAEIKAGRFREDLYYRLNVFPIYVPPLRHKLEDIPLLAGHFLQKASRQLGKEVEGFGDGVFELLQSYNWPGNVRELENEISRAVALMEAGMKLQSYHFSTNVVGSGSLIGDVFSELPSYAKSVDHIRRRLIEEALRECGGNKSQAAKKLRMARASLIRHIKRLGIEDI